MKSLVGLVSMCLALSVTRASAEETPPPVGDDPVVGELDAALAEGRLGAAALRCEELKSAGALSVEVRSRCGKILLGLGDRLHEAGSSSSARVRWEEAAVFDPRLLDDPSYLGRLKGSGPETPTPTETEVKSPAAKPIALSSHTTTRPPPEPSDVPKMPGLDSGPRWDRGFGMGFSLGFDGLMAATLAWLTDESLLLEVSFGIAYPAADVRFRWLGLRNCVTPFLGAGVLVPFGQNDRMGLDIGAYDNLYELGESVHVDIGLAYMPIFGLDLYAGVAFLTPMDQEHPDTVMFFPQFSAGVNWFF